VVGEHTNYEKTHTHMISYKSRLMLYFVLLCENKSQRSLIVLHVVSEHVL